ncbi:hypothetical protein Rhe02_28760 [Rhizocola hellebori]|uniref:Uncharacterized protein n=1 Tax=Rhizocola hellebori TaxID=1392758 RepID=A0A8J3VEV7_9ACTN|nr:hypothetical protein Rhe02_28760 [Rhizocola hellebori]
MPGKGIVGGLARLQIVKGLELEVPGADPETTLRNVQAGPDGHDSQLGLAVVGVFMIHEISHGHPVGARWHPDADLCWGFQ